MNMNIKTDSNLNVGYNNEFNKKQILVLLMFTILGISIGWLGFLLFGDIGDQCKIIYVSQKEILRLEKERISQQPKEKNLFFGKINQAIELINSEAQKYKDKRSKVIFVIDNFITGEGTLSISKQVHQNVIDNLAKLLANLKQANSFDRLEDNNLGEVTINKQPQL
ncbi:hypothetical protein [Candidatus Tisiphia endosymbiont of Oplodontha viridula]|uniref:hypothetical protein n=1 Tax=Candidatus Tisiphia endosymbiont of Oplodontha viridula TaxID=3077925 RepID=UPI0035C8D3A7